MKDILNIDKLNIIIASNEDILFLIKTSTKLLRVKYLRYQEVIDDFLGSYSFDALLDLNLSKGFTFSNAKILLNNSLLLSYNKKNENFVELFELQQKYKQYLINDKLNLEKYENANIILYNYYRTDDLLNSAIEKLEENFPVIKYYSKECESSNVYFNEYSTIDKEVKDLTYKVAELLHNNVPSEDIVIINNNSEYDAILRAYFNLANISLSDELVPLIHYEFVKNIINEIFVYDDINLVNSFNKIVERYTKFSRAETKLIKEINKVIASLVNLNLNKMELKDLVVYLLTKKTFTLNKYKNVIHVENKLTRQYKHIFMIGLTDDRCSYLYKNNEYISDKQRDALNLLSSSEKNREHEKEVIHFLKNSLNLYLSYSINTNSGIKQKPVILDKFFYQEYKIDDKIAYSKNINELRFKILLEQYLKYHEESQELYDLSGNYGDAEKKVYSNNFTGINDKLLYNYLNKGVVLSYTSIDEYYKCAFRFYIRRILKIDKIIDQDPLIIGNIFHQVLSHADDEILDCNKYIDDYLRTNNINATGYLGHFINKYKMHLNILIPYLKEFHSRSKFKDFFLEEKYEFILDEKHNIKLKGFIDKVMAYDYLGRKYFIVIDYKTGNAKVDFNNLVYGLDMQLLVYFYLLSKHYSNWGFAGSYLQRVLPTSITMYNGKNFDEEFKKLFSLDGYSNNDYIVLNSICENIDSGEYVKGINFLKGTTNLNANAKKRTFSNEDFNKLLKLAENKILEATENILNSNFNINPKKGNSNDSCKYCPYKNICYKTENDYVKLDDVKDYSFLEDK